jgi:hypothetical protein
MRGALPAAAAVLAVGLASAEGAQACSCVTRHDLRAAMEHADGAFIGRLVAVRAVNPPAEDEPVSSADPTDYVYRVGRVFNGGPGLKRGRKVSVRSVRDGATCGLPRTRGRLYGLLAYRERRRWRSDSCNVFAPAELRGAWRAGAAAGSSGCA